MSSQLRLETLAVHAGRDIDQASGAVAAAIVPSVTFQRDAEGHYPLGYLYSSKGNPNRNSLEAAFAALEGGVTAVAFASGCAAITAVLRTLRPIPADQKIGLFRTLRHLMAPSGRLINIVSSPEIYVLTNGPRSQPSFFRRTTRQEPERSFAL